LQATLFPKNYTTPGFSKPRDFPFIPIKISALANSSEVELRVIHRSSFYVGLRMLMSQSGLPIREIQVPFIPVKILFIGDIVGEPGRKALRKVLPRFREEKGVSLVIANGENAAGGAGITRNTAKELFEAGVDVITTGDHIWDHKEALDLVAEEPRVLRPLNYPPGVPGSGSILWKTPDHYEVAVINLQGRVFMGEMENPFVAVNAELERLNGCTPIIVVDFHAEATSEKIAMARMLDGRVSAVLGTHTHVQTADEQILPGGTAFLCDVGFTGPHESVIGRKIEPVIKRFLTGLPQRFEVATSDVRVQGALIEIQPETGRATDITRVSLRVSD